MKPTKPRVFPASTPLSILALGALAGACTQPQMAVPPDLNQGMDELPVQGRSMASGMMVNEDFKIDPYQVANVSRGAKSTTRFSLFGSTTNNSRSGYSFDFKSGDKTVHGECLAEAGEKGFSLGSGTSIGKQTAKLGCACGNEGAPTASVVMSSETGKTYGGTLKAHGDSYVLKALYERQGAMLSDGGPAGYRVDGKGAVGAVDVMGKGRVWIQKGLSADQRGDLACVFAGLLLYQVPKD